MGGLNIGSITGVPIYLAILIYLLYISVPIFIILIFYYLLRKRRGEYLLDIPELKFGFIILIFLMILGTLGVIIANKTEGCKEYDISIVSLCIEDYNSSEFYTIFNITNIGHTTIENLVFYNVINISPKYLYFDVLIPPILPNNTLTLSLPVPKEYKNNFVGTTAHIKGCKSREVFAPKSQLACEEPEILD